MRGTSKLSFRKLLNLNYRKEGCMILFAKVLRSVVEECDTATCTMFLIAFAQREGGIPIKFYLYRQILHRSILAEQKFEIICLEASSSEDAIYRYWPCSGATGKEFPGFRTNKWLPTNPWTELMSARSERKESDEELWIPIDSSMLKSLRDVRLSVLLEKHAVGTYVKGSM